MKRRIIQFINVENVKDVHIFNAERLGPFNDYIISDIQLIFPKVVCTKHYKKHKEVWKVTPPEIIPQLSNSGPWNYSEVLTRKQRLGSS
jgi:hypothetical protein